jgi:hypothetical protein
MNQITHTMDGRQLVEAKIGQWGQEAWPEDMRSPVTVALEAGHACPVTIIPERVRLAQVIQFPAGDTTIDIHVPDLTAVVNAYNQMAREEQGHSSQLAFYRELGLDAAVGALTTADVAARFFELASRSREDARRVFQHLVRNYGCIRITLWMAREILSCYPPELVRGGTGMTFTVTVDITQVESLRNIQVAQGMERVAQGELHFMDNLLLFIRNSGVWALLRAGEVQPADPLALPQRVHAGDARLDPARQEFYLQTMQCAGPYEPPAGECKKRGYVQYDLEDPATGRQLVFLDCNQVGNAAFIFLRRTNRAAPEDPDWRVKAAMMRRALTELLDPGQAPNRGALLARVEHEPGGHWQDEIRAIVRRQFARLGAAPPP